MTLDPQLRGSWRDLMSVLRPPSDYRLDAAVGTTFGMGFDALVAAMLAMVGADGDGLDRDPLATLVAATRLTPRIRVLVQAGTVSGSVSGLPMRLACLLDRIVVPVKLDTGLYHPKLWVVRYCSASPDESKRDIIRVLVGSRNLTTSYAFELGALLEGELEEQENEFGRSISSVLAANLRLGRTRSPHVANMVKALCRTTFRNPDAGRVSTRLHWQGPSGRAHHRLLPTRMQRALVVSPFLSASFVKDLLARAEFVRIVTTPGTLRQLDDASFASLQERAIHQGSPSVYVVTDEAEKEDEGKFEGLHAKAILCDDGKDSAAVTYLGSANATASGWAIGTKGNAETILELRPGLGMARLIRDFVVDKKGEPRPWMREYHADDRIPLADDEVLREQIRVALREVAAADYRVSYSGESRTLTLSLQTENGIPPFDLNGREVRIECIPLALLEANTGWSSVEDLVRAPATYSNFALCDVTAFVVVRATVGDYSLARTAIADLDVSAEMLDARDDAARRDILAHVSAEDVLTALILGLARLRSPDQRRLTSETSHGRGDPTRALQQVTIERTLQALAQNPDLIRELRLLMPDDADPVFLRFREDLESVLGQSNAQRR